MPTSPRVAREIFDFVRLKQGRVDNHQYDSFCLRDRYGHREAFAADVNYLARVKHLRLRLWEELDSRQAEIMLNSMHELTSLDVGLRKACFTGDPILLHLVIRAFSVGFQRPCIRSLRLDSVHFDHYGDPFPRLPGVQTLKHLQLANCINFGPFLQMLTALSLDLTTVVIKEQDSGSGSLDSDANDFIRSLSSPERLSLTLDSDFLESQFLCEWSALLDWSTLQKCAPVVKSLKVQYHSVLPPYPSDHSVSDFRHFCRNASSLEQLSISGIEVFINDTSGDKIRSSLEQFLSRAHLKLLLISAITDTHSQDCVRTASALVVLKLTMWVNCDAIPTRNDASTKALVKEAQNMAQRREHTAKRTADKIFSTLASDCPRLNVVVIETAWQYGWDDEFVRAFLK